MIVVIPASIVLTGFLLLALLSPYDVPAMLVGAIEMREKLVGSPADGMLLIERCTDSPKLENGPNLPTIIECNSTRIEEIEIEQYVSSILVPVRSIYILLMLIGFASLVATGSLFRYWHDKDRLQRYTYEDIDTRSGRSD